jgi:Zn-dependent peptidase ImmA (M78 family)
VNWQSAHRRAMLSAAHAVADYDRDRDGGRVADPFAAAATAGVLVLFRPLASLSGLYVREENIAGIMVNASHPLRLQRYTLAHELGHHLLGHASVADDSFSFGGDIVGDGRVVRSRDDEMVAEAFAAWFLMPRKQVLAAIARVGEAIVTPFEVYQLALRLGVSYEATARHLPNLRVADRAQLAGWLGRATRRQLRNQRERIAIAPMTKQRHDVWLLGPRDDGQQILARPGDRLVLALPAPAAAGHSWALAAPWTSQLSSDVADADACDPAVASASGSGRSTLITVDVPTVEGESSRARHMLTAVADPPADRSQQRSWSLTVNVQRPQFGIDDTFARGQAA